MSRNVLLLFLCNKAFLKSGIWLPYSSGSLPCLFITVVFHALISRSTRWVRALNRLWRFKQYSLHWNRTLDRRLVPGHQILELCELTFEVQQHVAWSLSLQAPCCGPRRNRTTISKGITVPPVESCTKILRVFWNQYIFFGEVSFAWQRVGVQLAYAWTQWRGLFPGFKIH